MARPAYGDKSELQFEVKYFVVRGYLPLTSVGAWILTRVAAVTSTTRFLTMTTTKIRT